MKIRTVYFKVAQMAPATEFWQMFLRIAPHKDFPEWAEFRCGEMNLAFLLMPEFSLAKDAANFVPVFELADDLLVGEVQRALTLGATMIVDVADHPDGMSYVLADPLCNEFELTRMHG